MKICHRNISLILQINLKRNSFFNMYGPSSCGSKILLLLLASIILWYIYMDINLYWQIQSYSLSDLVTNETNKYDGGYWVDCEVSPLCEVTPKAVLLDHTNLYAFAPLVVITDKILEISKIEWITPNIISVSHVFIAMVSARCISSSTLAYQRIGVVLFEFRTFLDDFDGHVARIRKNLRGELSEIGTTGYYVDGICDALGTTALLIAIFVFLKNNPPRRGYVKLSLSFGVSESGDNVNYKIPTRILVRTIIFFSIQLILNSIAWNRYIAFYQESLRITSLDDDKKLLVFKSVQFFAISYLWRLINVHSETHLLLLAIFCDKLWEFLTRMVFFGFLLLALGVCVTELHVYQVMNYVFHLQNGITHAFSNI